MAFESKKLNKVLFPLGNLLKENIKREAQKKNFPVFPYSESQEICFIPEKLEQF